MELGPVDRHVRHLAPLLAVGYRSNVMIATADLRIADAAQGRRAKCALGVIVTALWAGVLTATLPDIALTDDADAHLRASISYAQWTARVLGGDRTALRQAEVERHWRLNAEHPPLAKLAMGAGWWAFYNKFRWTDQVTAARIGTVAFSTLLAWLLFSFCWDYVGRLAAIAAPLFLVTAPSFFFHSHVEAFDVAVAAMTFLTFSTFVRSLRSARWAVLCGVAFGLSLLAKLNAPFFLLAFAVFPFVARSSRLRIDSGRVVGIPLALPMMIAIGPLIFFALWPWMWFDTAARLFEYGRFHLHHYGILFLYFGRIYGDAPAPWHAPFVMTAITTPPMMLALAAAGAIIAPRVPGDAAEDDGDFRADVGRLLLLAAAAAIVPVALPRVPKYAGVKLFLPLFPFLAVLAAWTVDWIASRIRKGLTSSWHAAERVVGPLLVAAAVLPGIIGLVRIHPYELSYYNVLVGGLPGAVRAGFERQYYDLVYVEMVDWFNAALPRGARITFLPNNIEYVRNGRWWFEAGRIRPDLRFVDLPDADVLVLTHERRWPQYPALAARYRHHTVLWQLEVEGVPLLTVYRL